MQTFRQIIKQILSWGIALAIALFIMNLIPAFAALLLYPYYLEFKKSDKKDIKSKKRKK